jgi:hypothetical protein
MDTTAIGYYFGRMAEQRKLRNLFSVGPSIEADLRFLGINSVEELIGQDAGELFERLQAKTGQRQDPCVHDVFSAAIAQAENPDFPDEQRRWWYWSRIRKGAMR